MRHRARKNLRAMIHELFRNLASHFGGRSRCLGVGPTPLAPMKAQILREGEGVSLLPRTLYFAVHGAVAFGRRGKGVDDVTR